MIRCSLRENREREQREWWIPLISDYFNLESNIDICRICRRARETRFGRMFFPDEIGP